MVNTNDHPSIKVNPFLIVAGALAATVAAQWLRPLPFLPATVARIVGTVVFLLGIAFGLPAARLMRAERTSFNPSRATTALVTSGRFHLSRNPIYVAMLLNYTGLCIFLGTLWGLGLIPVVIWLMNRWVIIPEEEYLGRKFGMAYAEYLPAVPRWL